MKSWSVFQEAIEVCTVHRQGLPESLIGDPTVMITGMGSTAGFLPRQWFGDL